MSADHSRSVLTLLALAVPVVPSGACPQPRLRVSLRVGTQTRATRTHLCSARPHTGSVFTQAHCIWVTCFCACLVWPLQAFNKSLCCQALSRGLYLNTSIYKNDTWFFKRQRCFSVEYMYAVAVTDEAPLLCIQSLCSIV